MKQSHLGGRTKGLRRSQERQLDRLSQRRHPEDGLELLTLERLSELVLELKTPLHLIIDCLLYTSPSPRDATLSRMPSSA